MTRLTDLFSFTGAGVITSTPAQTSFIDGMVSFPQGEKRTIPLILEICIQSTVNSNSYSKVKLIDVVCQYLLDADKHINHNLYHIEYAEL